MTNILTTDNVTKRFGEVIGRQGDGTACQAGDRMQPLGVTRAQALFRGRVAAV